MFFFYDWCPCYAFHIFSCVFYGCSVFFSGLTTIKPQRKNRNNHKYTIFPFLLLVYWWLFRFCRVLSCFFPILRPMKPPRGEPRWAISTRRAWAPGCSDPALRTWWNPSGCGWCGLRRVAGWVAGGCWDDTSDEMDHSRTFPAFRCLAPVSLVIIYDVLRNYGKL